MDPNNDGRVSQECSFCGAKPENLDRLFVAERATICDRCIRSLAVINSVDLTQEPSAVAPLLGRWTRTVGADDSVSLQFGSDGILRSTTVDGSQVTSRFLRYTLYGSELTTVEMISCGERESGTVDVSGDVLTLRTKRGESVFNREDGGV